MSELLDSDANDNIETACTPMSSTLFDNEPQDADSIKDPRVE